jgi:hypothetical protein
MMIGLFGFFIMFYFLYPNLIVAFSTTVSLAIF